MRLATVRTARGNRAVRVEGSKIIYLDAPDVGALLTDPDWRVRAAAGGVMADLDESALAPVVPAPSKIFAVGFNFPDHAAEVDRPLPDFPSVFAKFARSLTGPRDPMLLPHRTLSVDNDWEVELVAIIGKGGRDIAVADAHEHIAGYCVGNDGSVRDWQMRNRPPLAGKVWEEMTPVGPWLTTTDEVSIDDMQMVLDVDGVVMQQGWASEMIFGPETMIAYLSTIITLDPGDLIFLGTPSGIGWGRDPAVWLEDGQTVRASIAGLGELINVCRVREIA